MRSVGSSRFLTHRIHGAAIHGNIYHQYTPFMLAYIPAPWILWVSKKNGFADPSHPKSAKVRYQYPGAPTEESINDCSSKKCAHKNRVPKFAETVIYVIFIYFPNRKTTMTRKPILLFSLALFLSNPSNGIELDLQGTARCDMPLIEVFGTLALVALAS